MFIMVKNPSISSKRAITSHINSINMKKTTYDVRNPCAGLGQLHKCGGVISVKLTTTLPLLKMGSPTETRIQTNDEEEKRSERRKKASQTWIFQVLPYCYCFFINKRQLILDRELKT